MDAIRLEGYAYDNKECEPGLACYALSILDAADTAIAAISISGPATRMVQNKAAHLSRLQDAAARIMGLLR